METTRAIHKLRRELAEKEAEATYWKNEFDSLKLLFDNLNKDIDELGDRSQESLIRENRFLSVELSTIRDENEQLKVEIDKLEKENDRITDELKAKGRISDDNRSSENRSNFSLFSGSYYRDGFESPLLSPTYQPTDSQRKLTDMEEKSENILDANIKLEKNIAVLDQEIIDLKIIIENFQSNYALKELKDLKQLFKKIVDAFEDAYDSDNKDHFIFNVNRIYPALKLLLNRYYAIYKGIKTGVPPTELMEINVSDMFEKVIAIESNFESSVQNLKEISLMKSNSTEIPDTDDPQKLHKVDTEGHDKADDHHKNENEKSEGGDNDKRKLDDVHRNEE